MSKNMENPLNPVVKKGIEYHSAWVLSQKNMDALEGNLLAILEGVGLPEKQENALKSQFRQTLWRPIRNALFLSAEEVAEIGASKGLKSEGLVPHSVIG